MVVAGTGHRPQSLGCAPSGSALEARIKGNTAEILHELGPTKVLSGMALGFDTWLVEVCIDLAIPFDAIVPFQGQEKVWRPEQRRHYQQLLQRAHEVVVVCDGGYALWKLQRRNEYLVDHADLLLAAWDGSSLGGTANCVRYAVARGRNVRRIAW